MRPCVFCIGVIGSKESRSRFLPESTLAKLELGFKVEVDLEEGLKRTIEWNKRRRSIQTEENTAPLDYVKNSCSQK